MTNTLHIQVLGVGCAKHKALVQQVNLALQELGLSAEIEEIDDVETFLRLNIRLVPSLLVNGQVLSKGRVPSLSELIEGMRSIENDKLKSQNKPGAA